MHNVVAPTGARTLSAALRIQGVQVGRFMAGRLMREADCSARSGALFEALGERYPRAELCRVFDVQRSSVYEACKTPSPS